MGSPHSPQSSNQYTKLPLDPVDSLVILGQLLNDHNLGEEVVLIGGQALYLWSLRYPTQLPPFEEAHLTSKDLDYVRKIGRNIQVLVDAWRATGVKNAGMDDPQTPHEALVYFIDVDNKEVVVDIMDSVLGVTKAEVLSKADLIDVNGTPIWLMNPIHCLYSRIANTFGRGLSDEKYSREVVRVRAAIDICRDWLSEYLDNGMANNSLTEAVRAVNYLVRYCRTAPARKVARRTGINVADALPMAHECWKGTWEMQQFKLKSLIPVKDKLGAIISATYSPICATGSTDRTA